jgi:hypothetical protein
MNNTPSLMTHERIMTGEEYVSYADYINVSYKLENAEQSLEVATEHLKLCAVVVEKAKELINRWDQPSWKDTAPTAGFINALRNAIKSYEEEIQ